MEDAIASVCGLASDAEMARKVLVERNAIAEQILDSVARLPREKVRDFLIDDAGTRTDRVGGMLLGAVAFGDRSGNPALRPQAGRSFAKPRRRNHGNWKGSELERGKQSRKSGTDNDDATGFLGSLTARVHRTQ